MVSNYISSFISHYILYHYAPFLLSNLPLHSVTSVLCIHAKYCRMSSSSNPFLSPPKKISFFKTQNQMSFLCKGCLNTVTQWLSDSLLSTQLQRTYRMYHKMCTFPVYMLSTSLELEGKSHVFHSFVSLPLSTNCSDYNIVNIQTCLLRWWKTK